MTPSLVIRMLRTDDAEAIAAAFTEMNKPADQFVRYANEQREGIRDCWVALLGQDFAGYVTLHWQPSYPGLTGTGVPEIQDLNVLPRFRRRRLATALLDQAEAAARERSSVVGIGVGLHPGYNAAQRLYVLRGYVPDARGVTYGDRFVVEREEVPFDDELVLHFTKELRTS